MPNQTHQTRPLPTLDAVLLRRRQRVQVPEPSGGEPSRAAFNDLEIALQLNGMVMERPLYEAVQTLSGEQLRRFASGFLPLSLEQYGADRHHRALLRHFPDQTTPQDTYEVYLRRLIAFVLKDPQQPCALDGDDRAYGLSRAPSVIPARACVYGMFDINEFGGCPVCGRVVTDLTGEPQLEFSREQLAYFTALHLDPDPLQTAREELLALLARTTPLSPQEKDDLRVLLAALGADAVPLLPDDVPQRETLALLLGTLLAPPFAPAQEVKEHMRAAALARLTRYTKTATDLLRVLDVMGGGDGSLLGNNNKPRLSRALRRAFLSRLEALDPRNLTEDLHRHSARWKRMGEVLHPFEYAQQFPNVAVAFAALRGTTPQNDELGELLRGAALDGLVLVPERKSDTRTGPRKALKKQGQAEQEIFSELWDQVIRGWQAKNQNDWYELHTQLLEETQAKAKAEAQRLSQSTINPAYADIPHPAHLKFTGWNGQVEKALAQGDTPTLLRLLGQRPGELGRRADKTLQVAGAAAVPVLLEALPKLTAPVLLLLRSHLPARATTWPTRLMFPRASAYSFALPDTRPLLDPALTLPVVNGITKELLARAAHLPHFALAVLDERLKDLPIAFSTRNAARSLVTLGRGAILKLPEGRFARLFVHWMEYPQQRVDLDLSAAFYGSNWTKLGECTFYNLRFEGTGAVHSGDFTSAPAPAGASEFIDLDTGVLLKKGVQYVVMTVMSYNDVSFEHMAEAFAGYMLREHAGGQLLDARTVEQRFDLRGAQKVSVPLALDIHAGTLHWLDTTPKTKAIGAVVGHQVAAYADELGLSARRTLEAASTRARPTLWDLAHIHATARADALWTRGKDGVLRDENGQQQERLPGVPTFGAFLFRDVALPAGSLSVSLRQQVLDGAEQQTVEGLLDTLGG